MKFNAKNLSNLLNDSLHRDIILHIFSFIENRYILSRVCKLWYSCYKKSILSLLPKKDKLPGHIFNSQLLRLRYYSGDSIFKKDTTIKLFIKAMENMLVDIKNEHGDICTFIFVVKNYQSDDKIIIFHNSNGIKFTYSYKSIDCVSFKLFSQLFDVLNRLEFNRLSPHKINVYFLGNKSDVCNLNSFYEEQN